MSYEERFQFARMTPDALIFYDTQTGREVAINRAEWAQHERMKRLSR